MGQSTYLRHSAENIVLFRCLLNVYEPERPLRSSLDPNILSIAAAKTMSYGQRAFAYQGPINWSRVPGSIRTVEEKDTFKRHLKAALFQQNQ